MPFTERQVWTMFHGIVLGGGLLLVSPIVLNALWILRPDWVSKVGIERLVRRLRVGSWVMAIFTWSAVLTGLLIVLPWYRATPPQNPADLAHFPQAYLLANPNLAAWHTYWGLWKQHIGLITPLLATSIAYVATRYGAQLAEERELRRILVVVATILFALIVVAAILGALINKLAPVR